MLTSVREFLKHDSAGGILLVAAAILAMICANSPLSDWYDHFLHTQAGVHVGGIGLEKPILLWVNDGLMSLFFFYVGLELKREVLDGELSSPAQVVLPAIGAVGGMVMPAVVYFLINGDNEAAMRGWAIPTATDIAFALGVLTLLGDRVPTSLKVFLVSLAIFDDIGAIIIIALFYTADLSPISLVLASICLVVLFAMNRRGVMSEAPYLLVGVVLWASVLQSGVHATLAGVALAMFIPYSDKSKPNYSPLKHIEHSLSGAVTFAILPIFAFANAGLSLEGMSLGSLLEPVPLGIALGLFVGKQLGVFGTCWLAVKIGLAKLPRGMAFRELFGLATMCGIGFTMSLFIGGLAFGEGHGADAGAGPRLGVMVGSLLSAIVGYMILNWSLPKHSETVSEK